MPSVAKPATPTETTQVALSELLEFEGNPRRGNVEEIEKSLRAHGQYRALVVQRSTMRVIAGNHTLAALRGIGAEHALVHLLDVDPARGLAARVLLPREQLQLVETSGPGAMRGPEGRCDHELVFE